MLPEHHSGMDPESTTEIVRVKTASSDDETYLISTCLSFCSIPPWTRPWIRLLGLFVASLNTGGVITIPPHYHRCSRVQSPRSLLQQALFFFFFSVFRIITTITNYCDFQYTTRSVWGFTGAQVSGVLTGCMATRAARQKKKFLTEVRAADRVDSEALIEF